MPTYSANTAWGNLTTMYVSERKRTAAITVVFRTVRFRSTSGGSAGEFMSTYTSRFTSGIYNSAAFLKTKLAISISGCSS